MMKKCLKKSKNQKSGKLKSTNADYKINMIGENDTMRFSASWIGKIICFITLFILIYVFTGLL